MHNMRVLLILLFVIVIHSGYSQTQPNYLVFYRPYTSTSEDNTYSKMSYKFDFRTQYKNLKAADIHKDVVNAVAHNDFRFISISGYSYLYPGLEGGYRKLPDGTKEFIYLDEKYEAYIKKHGFKVIAGTSDVISSNEPPLQDVAYDYAKYYNELLLQALPLDKH